MSIEIKKIEKITKDISILADIHISLVDMIEMFRRKLKWKIKTRYKMMAPKR